MREHPDREFPPTVVDSSKYDHGIELHLLDGGTEEDPRYVWIPETGDPEFHL